MSEELTKEGLDGLERALNLVIPAKGEGANLLKAVQMARRTLQAEERLAKAHTTIFFFASVIKCGESWSPECQKWMDEALGSPEALHPPAQCAPPVEPDVPPDEPLWVVTDAGTKCHICGKHGNHWCRASSHEADDGPDPTLKAMRKGLDDHSCNSTGWGK